MKQISFKHVTLKDGFWQKKQEMNKNVTIHSVWEQFDKTGRVEAFTCNWKEGMDNKPHIFWDSDIAKWIEAASYIITKESDSQLIERIEWVIDQIEKNQDDSGYFNIYYLVCEPDKRFTDRDCHELYCAGHLIEAAVAYYYATGKDRFLKLMIKYADYIERIFVKNELIDGRPASFTSPGHEEIELALVKLYQCTGEKRYLNLSEFFLSQRGQKRPDSNPNSRWNGNPVIQDHLPVKEQHFAIGHSVRACYLYCAMADMAIETGDAEYISACKDLFDDIKNKKMYLTGGIGSSNLGEAFTIEYDLPNARAYAETCAAIGLMLFSRRMSMIDADSKYQDVLERAMYNGMLSGISLDGKGFFYENPLEINLKHRQKHISTPDKAERFPITQRPEVFSCSCCPPNLNRIFAAIGDYCYGVEQDTLYVHQFMASTLETEKISASLKTNYPIGGTVTLEVSGVSYIKIRIPGWCQNFSVNAKYILKNGYAEIKNENKPITVTFDMTPQLIAASPRVWENINKVAVQRGPIVYCLEGIDNGDNINNLYLNKTTQFKEEFSDYFNNIVLTAKGFFKQDSDILYSPLNDQFEETDLTLIPYHCFANRGESDMLVWMNYR